MSARLPNATAVNVRLHNESVGTLARTSEGLSAFSYTPEWLANGFSISPFDLPLESRVFIADWRPFEGLFGIFNDSLPDGWGRLLVDRSLKEAGIDPLSVDTLTRLAIVGTNGMGALEYEPQIEMGQAALVDDFDRIAEECTRMLETDYSDDIDELFALGGSSGGARPKILTAIDGEDWIVKFPSSVDPSNIGAQEFTIMQAAQACGINVPETRLLPSHQCEGYFATKRFDRFIDQRGARRKIHMASVSALLNTSHRIPNLDYDLLMRLTMRLTRDIAEVERLYRLMAFNVFIGNRDDHARNFTYLQHLVDGKSVWTLSPAYDLTRNSGMNGEHATTVNGKGRDISLADVVEVGTRNGLTKRRANAIANLVKEAVDDLAKTKLTQRLEPTRKH